MRDNNPILNMLSRATDLLILNALMIVGCLPVFTIGASVTAGHFCAQRIKREEGSVCKDFWRSFRENFKQATTVWMLVIIIAVGVLAVLWFYGKQSVWLSIAGCVALFLMSFVSLWSFPLLARFVYSVRDLLLNSMILFVRYLFHTLGMFLVSLLPFGAVFVTWYAVPFVLLYGFSLPVYLNASLYRRVFSHMEAIVLEQQEG